MRNRPAIRGRQFRWSRSVAAARNELQRTWANSLAGKRGLPKGAIAIGWHRSKCAHILTEWALARVSVSLSATTCKSWPAATIPSGALRNWSASQAAATRAAGASIDTRFMSADSFLVQRPRLLGRWGRVALRWAGKCVAIGQRSNTAPQPDER